MFFGGKAPLVFLRPAPPLRAPLRGLGYPKMKMKVIFGFPTIENPRIDITHDIW